MRRMLAPFIIGLIGSAILVGLGIWQVQRLAWKEAVLDEIEARIAAEADDLPVLVDPETHRYQPVALEGEIGAGALRVLVSQKQVGAGWRIVSDFTTVEGRRVLLDRGFMPMTATGPLPGGGAARVTGNLHWPDDRNSATPENDTAGNTWFARDIGQMAEVLKTEPLLVIARDVTPSAPGVQPLPVDTGGIPNDHLNYAVTWFSLAAVWLAMTGVWMRRRLKEG